MNTKQSPTSKKVKDFMSQIGEAYKEHRKVELSMKPCPQCQFEQFKDGVCSHCGYGEKSEVEPTSNTEELEERLVHLVRVTNHTSPGQVTHVIEDIKKYVQQELTTVIETTRKETAREIKKDLEELIPKEECERLAINLGLYSGDTACLICGTDPIRQRDMILKVVDKYLTEGEEERKCSVCGSIGTTERNESGTE